MARRSDPQSVLANAVLAIGLLIAAFSGTCTVVNSRALLGGDSPDERYQRGWTVLFIYFGSLVFGGVLALTALLWRGLSGRGWSEPPSRFRLSARRAFATGFLIVALTMITIGVAGAMTQQGDEVVYPLLLTGLPAALFAYGAYRAWPRRLKVSRVERRPE